MTNPSIDLSNFTKFSISTTWCLLLPHFVKKNNYTIQMLQIHILRQLVASLWYGLNKIIITSLFLTPKVWDLYIGLWKTSVQYELYWTISWYGLCSNNAFTCKVKSNTIRTRHMHVEQSIRIIIMRSCIIQNQYIL